MEKLVKITKKTELSPKRERFCREYVIDHNATQAYIRAGYSKNGAGQSAKSLLKIPEVAARIKELEVKERERLRKAYRVTSEELVRGFRAIAFEEEDVAHKDRITAMDKLARHIGFYELDNEQRINPFAHLPQPEVAKRLEELKKKAVA